MSKSIWFDQSIQGRLCEEANFNKKFQLLHSKFRCNKEWYSVGLMINGLIFEFSLVYFVGWSGHGFTFAVTVNRKMIVLHHLAPPL